MRSCTMTPLFRVCKTTRPLTFCWLACIALAVRVFADDVPNNGEDFTRLPARFDFRYRFEEKAGDVAQDTFIPRIDRPFRLGDGWKISTRLDVPFILSDKALGGSPPGNYHFGFDDVLVQAALIDEFSKRWAAGIGPRLVLDTASQEQFGSGKTQLGPIGAVRCFLPEISEGSFAEVIVRYDCDIAGSSERSHISRIRWSPPVNISLPQDWFVTLFPSQDIAVNFLDGSKWFFPLDLLVGKNLSSKTAVSLEASVPIVKDYDLYDFKLEARFSFTF